MNKFLKELNEKLLKNENIKIMKRKIDEVDMRIKQEKRGINNQ